MTTKLFRQPTDASIVSAAPSTLCPPYEQLNVELSDLSPSASSASLPTYEAATEAESGPGVPASFRITQSLQIEAAGKALLGLPLPPRPDPIPVYDVTNGKPAEGVPLYVSLRSSRGSGTSSLVRGDDDMIDNTPLCTTTYQFGLGRPPRVTLHGKDGPPPPDSSSASASVPDDDGLTFEFVSKNLLHRTQVLKCHLGTFEWRYAARKERKGVGADSLLVFEKVVKIATAGGKSEDQRTLVAQFVRNEGTRTLGSGRSTAGNGGRLLVDLSEWMGNGKKADEEEEMRLLVVATCISMLKKEVDRRRMHQTIVIAGGAGGGGP